MPPTSLELLPQLELHDRMQVSSARSNATSPAGLTEA
jgi:hypothetical protein